MKALLVLAVLVPSGPADLAERIDFAVSRVSRTVSPLVDDGLYVRRVMLDLVGRPPTAGETKTFLADEDPDRRAHLVDRMLEAHAFADHWARRLAEVLLGDTKSFRTALPLAADVRGRMTGDFIRWLAGRIRDDRPWGETVGAMVSARGTTDRRPELAWKLSFLREKDSALEFAARGGRQLLGITLECSRCHDHPFDRWTVDDTYGLAAFVVRQRTRLLPATKEATMRVEVSESDAGEMVLEDRFFPRLLFPPRLLTSGAKPDEGESRLDGLGRLLADDVQLSRVLVNRVWSWLIGRGVVHPVDDFNYRHKPLSQELLEALRRGFDENGGSIKSLVRAICASETYRRSCESDGAPMRTDFSRGLVLPLTTEQLLNSIQVATRLGPERDLAAAHDLAVAVSPATIDPPCEVTRFTFTRWEALYVRNNERLWDWVRNGGVLARIRERSCTPDAKVEEMFLAALSRRPSEPERRRFVDFLGDGADERFEDAYWALLNSHEFLTRH